MPSVLFTLNLVKIEWELQYCRVFPGPATHGSSGCHRPVPAGNTGSAAPCAEYRQNTNLSIHKCILGEYLPKAFGAVLPEFREGRLRNQILPVFPDNRCVRGLCAIPVSTVQSPRPPGANIPKNFTLPIRTFPRPGRACPQFPASFRHPHRPALPLPYPNV